jgi:hypothetical protein
VTHFVVTRHVASVLLGSRLKLLAHGKCRQFRIGSNLVVQCHQVVNQLDLINNGSGVCIRTGFAERPVDLSSRPRTNRRAARPAGCQCQARDHKTTACQLRERHERIVVEWFLVSREISVAPPRKLHLMEGIGGLLRDRR